MMKSLKILVLSVTFFSFQPQSFAGDDDENLRRILKTRSNGQLTRFVADRRKAQRLRLICDAQLRSARVPGSCFEFMKLNMEAKKESAWLDRLCVARVGSSRDWRELHAIAKSKAVSVRCREAALRREEDIQYMDQAERPAEVFARGL